MYTCIPLIAYSLVKKILFEKKEQTVQALTDTVCTRCSFCMCTKFEVQNGRTSKTGPAMMSREEPLLSASKLLYYMYCIVANADYIS